MSESVSGYYTGELPPQASSSNSSGGGNFFSETLPDILNTVGDTAVGIFQAQNQGGGGGGDQSPPPTGPNPNLPRANRASIGGGISSSTILIVAVILVLGFVFSQQIG
jgi:hypothetical protein